MREIIITANDAGRRLDRFLRKYLSNASLGEIYKLIRKDIKVDGKRRAESYMLSEGETLTLYISDEVLESLTGGSSGRSGNEGSGSRNGGSTSSGGRTKKQFRIIYEDPRILIVSKPYGLLTHGDRSEKKNHLANQVRDYLIAQGEYDPRAEKVFAPAPANRLDRNTTGLVLFGKTGAALKALNLMIREDLTDKYYLTIVHGVISEPVRLTGSLTKDETHNKVRIDGIRTGALDEGPGIDQLHRRNADDSSLPVITEVSPVEVLDFGSGMKATLVEIRLVTGRSHQIRAHMAGIGHPVIGDSKYAHTSSGDRRSVDRLNDHLEKTCKLSTQLLHAYRLCFAQEGLPDELAYLAGKSFEAKLPPAFTRILERGRSETIRR